MIKIFEINFGAVIKKSSKPNFVWKNFLENVYSNVFQYFIKIHQTLTRYIKMKVNYLHFWSHHISKVFFKQNLVSRIFQCFKDILEFFYHIFLSLKSEKKTKNEENAYIKH